MTTPLAGARVETFDGRKAARYSGAGRTLIGTFPDSTKPEGDETAYYSVKPVVAAFVAEPGVSYNYFELYWGTIDEYNELRFFRDGRLIATVNGRQVLRLIDARGKPRPRFQAATSTFTSARKPIPASSSEHPSPRSSRTITPSTLW